MRRSLRQGHASSEKSGTTATAGLGAHFFGGTCQIRRLLFQEPVPYTPTLIRSFPSIWMMLLLNGIIFADIFAAFLVNIVLQLYFTYRLRVCPLFLSGSESTGYWSLPGRRLSLDANNNITEKRTSRCGLQGRLPFLSPRNVRKWPFFGAKVVFEQYCILVLNILPKDLVLLPIVMQSIERSIWRCYFNNEVGLIILYEEKGKI